MKSKKSIAILLTILLLCIASATLFACNNGSTPGGDYSILPDDSGKNEVSFTATFIYSDGSTQPYSVTGLTAGSKISLNSVTRNPKREGYEFAGWYTEPDGGSLETRLQGIEFYEKKGDEFDWNTMKQVTLYAGWVKN